MKRYTKKYAEQNIRLHEQKEVRYGARGHRSIDRIIELIPSPQFNSILDYGCGKATFAKHWKSLGYVGHVTSYDPFVPKYSKEPTGGTKFDLVLSTDVLEHIEPNYIVNVLNHIESFSERWVYLLINTQLDRSKTLPDGTNPHKSVYDADTWKDIILNRTNFSLQNYELQHFGLYGTHPHVEVVLLNNQNGKNQGFNR